MKKRKLKLTIPISNKFISSARLAISGLANQANMPIDDIEKIKNALTDACKTAIENAYAKDKKDKYLNISCSYDQKSFDVSVQNKGIKINIKKQAHLH